MQSFENREGGFHGRIVSRPIGLLVIFLTLIVIGVISYNRIPIQMLPSGLSGTRLSVWVNHDGSSAQENEEKVARPLEEEFRTLQGVDDIWSSSTDDGVRVGLSFAGTTAMDLAKSEVRDRIERARSQLPGTVDRIFVWANDESDLPVMFFAVLQKEFSEDTDFLIEKHVQRRIEAIDGVSQVDIWGMLDDSIRILLDEDKVRAARLDIGSLVRRLASDNFATPLGEVNDGGREYLLRSDMRFRSLDEIGDYPLGDGLILSDIASVERVKTVRERLTRIDGKTAYYGMVQKESTANVVEVGRKIDLAIAELREDSALGGNLDIQPIFNQANFIETSLDSLRQTALWGGGLAVIVLFVFLRRARMTLAVALSIPVSAMLSIAWEYFTGGTFNVLTMTGLTLGIGMLVDNSVVVMENIARIRLTGRSPHDSAVAGAREVGLAVALATLTSVVVFLPLVYMSDVPQMRVMLGALGIPLCTSLLFSLLVALVFLPVVAARIQGARPAPVERLAGHISSFVALPVQALGILLGLLRRLAFGVVFVLQRLTRLTLALLTPLRFVLAAGLLALVFWRVAATRGVIESTQRISDLGLDLASTEVAQKSIGGMIAAAVLGIALLLFGLPRWRRRPSAAPRPPAHWSPQGNSILVWIQQANHGLLSWTLQHRLLAMLFAVLALGSIAVPFSRMEMTAFGEDEDTTELEIDIKMEDNFTLAETSDELAFYEDLLEPYRERFGFDHLVASFRPGRGDIELRWTERIDPEDFEAYREELRRVIPKRAGHRLRFSGDQSVDSRSRQFVQFQLRGPDASSLEQYGARAIDILRDIPGLLDVSSSLEASPEQVRLSFDNEEAFKYGVSSDLALQSISWALRGAMLPRFQEEGREVPFLMEYDSEDLAGLDTLRDLEVYTQNSVVPLSTFATIGFERGSRRIFRWNGQTTFNIQARVNDPTRQAALVQAGYDALEELDMPRGFSLGRDDSVIARQEEEMSAMKYSLMLSIVLVFLLMGILLESLLLPISVLTTIPFAVLGALWTLFVTGTTMDSVGWIGVIILVGVVVNNGIVLIDKIHRLRLQGRARDEAVLEGARARVRPILMTALTTVFGLLPMAMGEAAREGIDYRALATCVAGGLTVSTFFTLWIVPLAYSLMEDLSLVQKRLWRRVASMPVRKMANRRSLEIGT